MLLPIILIITTIFVQQAICYTQERRQIKIGVILNELNPINEIALEKAAERVTQFSTRYNVSIITVRLGDSDSYEATKKVCRLVDQGVKAFIGPDNSLNSGIVENIARKLHIPNFQPFSNIHPAKNNPVMVFNLFPSNNYPAAIATFVRESDWKSFTVLYEDEGTLASVQDVLKSRKSTDMPILLRKMDDKKNYRPLLKELKAASQFQVLISSEIHNALELLKQANEVKGMLGEYSNYVLTSLDPHTLDFGDIKKTGANITSFRIIDIRSPAFGDAVSDWEAKLAKLKGTSAIKFDRQRVLTQTALLYDALNIFTTIYETLETQGGEFEDILISCNSEATSSFGKPISDYLLRNPFIGGNLPGPITGKIEFDNFGQRIHYELKLLKLEVNGVFNETGNWYWDKPKEIQSKVSKQEIETIITEHIQRKKFRVVSRIGAPYLMLKESHGKSSAGNYTLEGHSVDLIDGIANLLNFSYEFYIVPDKHYGSYHPETKQWDGLIREILDRKADLAVCDLTITYERRKAVDFTNPFMTLGVSILYSKAKKNPPALFSFMEPLSLNVWLYTATSYLLVTLIVFLVARLAQSDWENPHPCNSEPEELENIWNVKNCLWLTLGSIMCQGSDILPK